MRDGEPGGTHGTTHLSAPDKGTAAKKKGQEKSGAEKERERERTKEERQGITEKIWYAHVHKGSLPGSMWACSP